MAKKVYKIKIDVSDIKESMTIKLFRTRVPHSNGVASFKDEPSLLFAAKIAGEWTPVAGIGYEGILPDLLANPDQEKSATVLGGVTLSKVLRTSKE